MVVVHVKLYKPPVDDGRKGRVMHWTRGRWGYCCSCCCYCTGSARSGGSQYVHILQEEGAKVAQNGSTWREEGASVAV